MKDIFEILKKWDWRLVAMLQVPFTVAYILLPFVIITITYTSLRHQISKINKSHE